MKKIEDMKYWSDILSIQIMSENQLTKRTDMFAANQEKTAVEGEIRPGINLESKMTIVFYQE